MSGDGDNRLIEVVGKGFLLCYLVLMFTLVLGLVAGAMVAMIELLMRGPGSLVP
jgi:hypothetical protein